MKRAALLLLASISLAACERTRHDPPPARPTSTPAAPSSPAPRQTLLSARLSRPAAETVVAIGDLHGDLAAARRALKLAGAIDDDDHWSGGKLVVVQTGDVLDRGDDDRGILDWLDRLRAEAKRAGGELISLAGNHEIMNVMGDFRYITQGGFDAFGGQEARHDAFKPGGPYALKIAEKPIYVRVGDTLFVHGGVLEKHVDYGLDRIQDELRAWIRGETAQPPLPVMTEDGPIWTRLYSDPTLPGDCEQLGRVLAKLEAKRMVMGHTPQMNGITSSCEGRAWRIDTGMSRFYGGHVEVLEIRGAQAKVRK